MLEGAPTVTDQPPLPAIVLTFLATPAPTGPGSWVRAQVTNYAAADTTATDTLYCTLLLNTWELTVCMDGSHAELFNREALTTISMLGDWPSTLRHLRLMLADPRLDLLLAMPPVAEVDE